MNEEQQQSFIGIEFAEEEIGILMSALALALATIKKATGDFEGPPLDYLKVSHLLRIVADACRDTGMPKDHLLKLTDLICLDPYIKHLVRKDEELTERFLIDGKIYKFAEDYNLNILGKN